MLQVTPHYQKHSHIERCFQQKITVLHPTPSLNTNFTKNQTQYFMTGDSIIVTLLNDQRDTCIHWPAMLWTVEAIGYKLVFTDISVWLYNFLHIPEILAMSLFITRVLDYRIGLLLSTRHNIHHQVKWHYLKSIGEETWMMWPSSHQCADYQLGICPDSIIDESTWATKIDLSNLSCKTSVFSSHYLGKTMKDSAWCRKALPSANSSTYRNFDSLNPQGYCITVSNGHFQTTAKDGHCGCPNCSLKILKATRFSKSHWQWTPVELGVE